ITYYYLRFIASLLSVTGLFLLLSALDGVSPLGAYVMALVWNINLLCTPLIQYGNVSLFTFALACFGGYLWLVKWGKSAKFFSLGIFLMVINIRPEYALLLFLLGVQQAVLWLKKTKDEGLSKWRRLQLGIVIGIFLITSAVFGASANLRSTTKQFISGLD